MEEDAMSEITEVVVVSDASVAVERIAAAGFLAGTGTVHRPQPGGDRAAPQG
jgi:hypothetical protein